MGKKLNIGQIGETAVTLELQKLGLDTINLNGIRSNYQSVDLICMNLDTGKSVMIQVKTGTTRNIITGLVSELDGSIPNLQTKIIGPWVFVKMDDETFDMEFYVLTKEETIELISSSNNWYVNGWSRKLSSKPLIGIEVSWLQGKHVEASNEKSRKQHIAFKNPLGHNSKDRWDKIVSLLE
jgi:Holliday junction resolvase-like predicted endonuclease